MNKHSQQSLNLGLLSLSKYRSMKCRDTLENTRGKAAKVKEYQAEDEAEDGIERGREEGSGLEHGHILVHKG